MSVEPVALLDLPHSAARGLLASGAPVYLLVNPVEYHGPHLPLRTDALISRGLAADLHAALARPDWPFLLASPLELGVDPCPGPGTRHVSFRTVRHEVVTSCLRLAELGARRVVLMTFHGAPLHSLALEAGVRALMRRGVPAIQPLVLLLDTMIQVGRRPPEERRDHALAELGAAFVHLEPPQREALAAELAFDFHAGFFETSLVLHYAPAAVLPAHRTLPPCPAFVPRPPLLPRLLAALGARGLADELCLAFAGAAWYGLRPFPGYTGAPHLARAEAGRAFAARIVELYLAEARSVLLSGGAPARARLRWLPLLTLGGRFGRLDVPLPAVAPPPWAPSQLDPERSGS